MASYLKKNASKESIAAIDLGSNALRAVVAQYDGKTLDIIRSVRIGLRLGEDVFKTGTISRKKMIATEEAFIGLFQLFVEYNVTNLYPIATSAMRDAKNGKILSNKILKSTGIDLKTISGLKEAKLIIDAVSSQIKLNKRLAVLMDIGGGSTEISIIKDKEVLASHSFNIGTVRLLDIKNHDELESYIKKQLSPVIKFIKKHTKKKEIDYFIGTGGNLRRIGKIRKKTLNKDSLFALKDEIAQFRNSIKKMSISERAKKLELDSNRVEVLLPAIIITHQIMQLLKVKRIELPPVGLKEGLLLDLLSSHPKKIKLNDEN